MTLQSDLEAAFFDRPQSIIQGPFSSTTTVLIVHGGWHIPYHYQPLVSSFADAGYLTICPFLPTCNDAKPPNKTLDEDIGVVRAVLAVLAHTGKDIVVVMHSFGGLIGSVAIDGKDLKKQQRMQTLGTATGGVVALIFMSAFVALDDLSLAEALPGGLPDWIQPEVCAEYAESRYPHLDRSLDKTWKARGYCLQGCADSFFLRPMAHCRLSDRTISSTMTWRLQCSRR